MNISQDLLDLADEMANVESISTGGGFDYIWRQFDNGMEAIIVDPTQDGSPENLSEPAIMIIYADDEWHDNVQIPFDNARQAIIMLNAMVSM